MVALILIVARSIAGDTIRAAIVLTLSMTDNSFFAILYVKCHIFSSISVREILVYKRSDKNYCCTIQLVKILDLRKNGTLPP